MSDDPRSLIGKRVQHFCHDPDCPLKGRVMDVQYLPQRTLGGEASDWWVLVRWEAYGNVPEGYQQHVPLHKVKVIE